MGAKVNKNIAPPQPVHVFISNGVTMVRDTICLATEVVTTVETTLKGDFFRRLRKIEDEGIIKHMITFIEKVNASGTRRCG